VRTPELRFNTYGFNVSGPVFIRRSITRTATRLFLLQHGMAQADSSGNVNTTVPPPANTVASSWHITIPTSAQIANNPGLQSKLTSATGAALGQAFPGNRIPASLLTQCLALLQAGIFRRRRKRQPVLAQKLPTNLAKRSSAWTIASPTNSPSSALRERSVNQTSELRNGAATPFHYRNAIY